MKNLTPEPIWKHHKYPSKVSSNALGNFCFGWFFTPNPPKTAKSPNPPLQATRHLWPNAGWSRTQIGVWGAQNASKPSGNIINTRPKYLQTHLETFISGGFSPRIPQKRLSPPNPPRRLPGTCGLMHGDQIGVWRAQNASKPSGNIINTPPKYPQTHLETFFFGSFFTPNRPKTAKSPW